MATQVLHEVLFEWPHPEPMTVIVTGTFDEWSCSVPLTKTPTGFVGSTKISWGEKIKFKYVVDGQWVLHEDQVTETDPGGFVNHVYTAPAAPPATEEPSAALTTEAVAQSAVIEETPAADTPAEDVPEYVVDSSEQATDVMPEVEKPTDSEQAPNALSTGLPQFLSDIADTIAARDGTSSALGYVSSGLGAAIHNVVGVDPVNTQQIAIPTPATDAAFVLPGEQESVSNITALPIESNQDAANTSVQESLPSPIAPIVPLLIVPVNAAENNTVATSENNSDAAAAPFIPGPSSSLNDAVEPTATDGPSEAVVVVVVGEPTVSKAEDIEPIVVAEEEATSAAPESDPTDAVVSAIVEVPAHLPETVVDAPTVTTAAAETLPSEPIAETSERVAEVKVHEAEPIAVIEEAVVPPAEQQEPEPPVIIDDVAVEPVSDAPISTVVDTAADAEHPQEELKVSKPDEPVIDEALVIAAPVSEETIKKADVSVHNVPEPEPQVPVPPLEEVTAASVNEQQIPLVETVVGTVPIVEAEAEKSSTEPATGANSGAEAIVLPVMSIVESIHTVPAPEPDAVPEPIVAESAPAEVPQVSSPEEVPESTVTDSTSVEVPQVSSPEEVVAPVVVEKESSVVGEVATETPTQLNSVGEQTKVLAEESKQPVQPETAGATRTPPNGLDAESKTDISAANGHSSTVTPTGTTSKAFPSATESPTISADNSPSSSKVNTMRKKRTSILGKLKHIFQHDKDKK